MELSLRYQNYNIFCLEFKVKMEEKENWVKLNCLFKHISIN